MASLSLLIHLRVEMFDAEEDENEGSDDHNENAD